MHEEPGFALRNDHDEYADRPMPDPLTAMAWPVRLVVVVLILCALGAAYFH
jgi:hypothetical protein